MAFKTTLFLAIAHAEQVLCNGYEIHDFLFESGSCRLACGYDDIARVLDQEIEIDDYGFTMVQTVAMWDLDEGEEPDSSDTVPQVVQMGFFMSRPFRASDIPEGV